MHNPVFDDGLAVAACYAHNGYGELRAVALGDTLQHCHDILYKPDVGLLEGIQCGFLCIVDIAAGDEVAHALGIEFGDVVGTVVAFGADCKKEGVIGIGELAAVGKQTRERGVGRNDAAVDKL